MHTNCIITFVNIFIDSLVNLPPARIDDDMTKINSFKEFLPQTEMQHCENSVQKLMISLDSDESMNSIDHILPDQKVLSSHMKPKGIECKLM